MKNTFLNKNNNTTLTLVTAYYDLMKYEQRPKIEQKVFI